MNDAGTVTNDAGPATNDAGTVTNDAGPTTHDAGTVTNDAGPATNDAGCQNSVYRSRIRRRRLRWQCGPGCGSTQACSAAGQCVDLCVPDCFKQTMRYGTAAAKLSAPGCAANQTCTEHWRVHGRLRPQLFKQTMRYGRLRRNLRPGLQQQRDVMTTRQHCAPSISFGDVWPISRWRLVPAVTTARRRRQVCNLGKEARPRDLVNVESAECTVDLAARGAGNPGAKLSHRQADRRRISALGSACRVAVRPCPMRPAKRLRKWIVGAAE